MLIPDVGRFEKRPITDSTARQVRFDYPIWLPKNLSPISNYPISIKVRKIYSLFLKRIQIVKAIIKGNLMLFALNKPFLNNISIKKNTLLRKT